jgi:hypothetical protein
VKRATEPFIYLGPSGEEIFVPRDKVVVDDHPDVKGREMYFEPLRPEQAPEPPRRRARR